MLDEERDIGEILGVEPLQFADDEVGGRRRPDGEAQATEDGVIASFRIRTREDQRLLGYDLGRTDCSDGE